MNISRKAIRSTLPIFALALAGLANAQIDDERLCADQNADGLVTPADFTAWISNYNSNNPIADVNSDNTVTPADFTAWINAFNQGANGPNCFVDLGDGGTVSGSISHLGDVDTFSVFAEAGEDLLFSIDESPSSSAYLKVSLYAPDGSLYGVEWESNGFRLDKYDVPATGRYTYVIEDFYGDYTTDYVFTVVVADEKVDPGDVAISSGTTYSASLTPGDIDTYTISASAGDDLFFSVDETPRSDTYLLVSLHGPDGALITQDWESLGFRLDTLNVPSTGRYTYVVREFYGQYEGNYSFTAVVADGMPDDSSVELTSGQSVTGSIGYGDIDTFRIEARAGDDLFLAIDETPASDAYFYVTLHGPNGELLTSDWESLGMRIDYLNAPADGTYTYILRDFYGQYVGDYTLTAVVADDEIDADNVELVSGRTETGSIERGDIDTFTINASAGDDLFLAIDETPEASTYLYVSVHGPNGELLASDWESDGMRIDLYDLPATGRYTYVVRDFYGQYTGNYTLTSVVADGSIDDGNVALSSAQPVTGSIELGDIDTFTINASAGQDLFFSIDETPSSSVYFLVTVHGPSGQLLGIDWASTGFDLNTINVPATGRYTYVVRDYYGQYTGNYTLSAIATN